MFKLFNTIFIILTLYSHVIFKILSVIPNHSVLQRKHWEVFFPKLKSLESNWKDILKEYEQIQSLTSPISREIFFKEIVKKNQWKYFYIKNYNPIPERLYKLLPKTCKLIDACPDIMLAMFSIMEPGAVVLPHRGFYKGCIRVHLGLDCPTIREGCFIGIDGIISGWTNGKCKVWDDTYEHFVINNTEKKRVILFLDIRRPLKGGFHTQPFQKLCEKMAGVIVKNF